MLIIGLTYSASGMIEGFISTILIARYNSFYFFKNAFKF